MWPCNEPSRRPAVRRLSVGFSEIKGILPLRSLNGELGAFLKKMGFEESGS